MTHESPDTRAVHAREARHGTPQLERLGTHCERLRLHRVNLELSTLLEQAAKRELGYADFLDEVLGLEVRSKQEKHLAMRVSMARFPFHKNARELRLEIPALDRSQGDQGTGDGPLHR